MRPNTNLTAALGTALLLALSTTAFASELARDEVMRTEMRTIAIKGTPVLAIDHEHGSLRIKTHQKPEVHIDAVFRVSADTRDLANEFLAGMKIDVVETGTRITVRATHPDGNRRFRNVGYVIDFDVLVPATLPLEAKNLFGDTAVSGLVGGATIENGHGLLTATDGRGRYRLENQFGDIDAVVGCKVKNPNEHDNSSCMDVARVKRSCQMRSSRPAAASRAPRSRRESDCR